VSTPDVNPPDGRLHVDEGSFAPLPEQIRRGIVDQIREGTLAVGDRLATVRQLARDLGLAPGTVAKAYQLLESDGVIETRGRRGTYVAKSAAATETDPRARAAARRYLAEVVAFGLSASQAAAVVAAEAKSDQMVTAAGRPVRTVPASISLARSL
jgi:DNA-binding transcriptional regulator YhcF (GntR family)